MVDLGNETVESRTSVKGNAVLSVCPLWPIFSLPPSLFRQWKERRRQKSWQLRWEEDTLRFSHPSEEEEEEEERRDVVRRSNGVDERRQRSFQTKFFVGNSDTHKKGERRRREMLRREREEDDHHPS